MWLVWGIVLSWLLLFTENFLSGWLPFNIPLGLVVGIALYVTLGKKIGLTILIAWAVWVDILFNPWLPISVASILLSWWLWRKYIDVHLSSQGYVTVLATAVSWFAIYLILHWFVSWLPYWLGDSILYPGVSTQASLLIWGWVVGLVLLSLLVVVFNKQAKNHD